MNIFKQFWDRGLPGLILLLPRKTVIEETFIRRPRFSVIPPRRDSVHFYRPTQAHGWKQKKEEKPRFSGVTESRDFQSNVILIRQFLNVINEMVNARAEFLMRS